jgi:NTE family protein
MEAGGIMALYEAGIQPEVVVGSSAGAMNAAFLAAVPSLEGAERLCDIWRRTRNADVVPGGWLRRAWRLLRGKPSLFAQEPLRAFVEAKLPAGVRRFGDLPPGVQLYVTAANLQTGDLYLFGQDPQADLVEAVLASSAFPGGFPPVHYGEWQYTDGGVISNVPVSVAIDQGATTIYALDVAYTGGKYGQARTALDVLLRVMGIMLYQDLLGELAYASQQPGITVHHVVIRGVAQASDFNFDHGAEMVEVGYRAVKRYLDRQDRQAGSALEVQPLPDEPAPAPAPPGARLWVPPSRRP